MNAQWTTINDLLVDTFNSILRVEQAALSRSQLQDISINDIHTLQAIGSPGQKSMGEIATQMKVGLSTLTAVIDKLEQKGYVRRFRADNDRRMVLIELILKGKVAQKMHVLYHKQMLDHALSGLDDQEQAVLIKTLTKLNAFFNSNDALHAYMEE